MERPHLRERGDRMAQGLKGLGMQLHMPGVGESLDGKEELEHWGAARAVLGCSG